MDAGDRCTGRAHIPEQAPLRRGFFCLDSGFTGVCLFTRLDHRGRGWAVFFPGQRRLLGIYASEDLARGLVKMHGHQCSMQWAGAEEFEGYHVDGLGPVSPNVSEAK